MPFSPRRGVPPRGEAGTAWQRLRRGLEHWDRGEGSKSPRAAPFHCSPRRTVEEMSGRSPEGHGRGGVLEHSSRVTFPFLNCFLPPSLHTHTRERRVGESSSRVLQRKRLSLHGTHRGAVTLPRGSTRQGWRDSSRVAQAFDQWSLAAARCFLSLGSDSLLEAPRAGALATGLAGALALPPGCVTQTRWCWDRGARARRRDGGEHQPGGLAAPG